MFKQLRHRMLILNLAMLTVLLASVFATLYLSTIDNIHSRIDRELTFILDSANNSLPNPNPIDGDINPERTVSFVIITDTEGNIVSTSSQFNVDDSEFFTDALALATHTKGTVSLDGNYWAYQSKLISGGVAYAFIDITSEQSVLNDLIVTFLIIFSISFVVIYFISTFITNKSVSAIKDAFIKQKQFVSNASHELKTPLAIINTNVDVLSTKIKDEETNKWLTYIKFETERMNKLTKDLLYLTKVSEQKAVEIVKERLNISEITESVILSFEASAYEKKLKLEYHIEPEIFTEFSRDQYIQVIHILMDNAIKYAPEEGWIKVHVSATHNMITISVKNSGDGISKDDIENIFDRFYMGDKSRSANPNSYGLGLSIAKSIIDNHNGKIYCESEVGHNTTFFIKLKMKSL